MHLPRSVEVVEVGPRDGLQNEPAMVSTEGKVALLKALTAAGIIEMPGSRDLSDVNFARESDSK